MGVKLRGLYEAVGTEEVPYFYGYPRYVLAQPEDQNMKRRLTPRLESTLR